MLRETYRSGSTLASPDSHTSCGANMTKMTKPQLTQLAKLEARREHATQAVYAGAAPRTDIRFNDCQAMASPAVQQAYSDAIMARETFHQEMINQGRAYRCDSFGHFTPNYR